MTYRIEGNTMLFNINRTQIIDISAHDFIEIKGFPGAKYEWTEQDTDFVENNPDDEIFLKLAKEKYRTTSHRASNG